MSAAGELAGYAGGDAVLAEANKVERADPGSISAAAGRLTTAATDAGTGGKSVADAVRALDAAWQGGSADAFVAYMDRFGKAGADVGAALTEAGKALTGAAEAIQTARSYVSSRCDQALAEIRDWIRRNPDAEQSQLDGFTHEVCGQVAADLRAHLTGTESTLAAAVGVITGARTPASTFAAIPAPDTQPFVPQPGKPIEWTRTPPEQTAPAGAPEPNGAAPPAAGSSAGGGGHSGGGGGSSHGGGGGLGSSGGPPAGGPPPGNVQEWIRQAIEILRANGINVSEADAQRIWQIIQHESGGNPHAINNWDSNAAKGTPSKGLMQTIDPTFNSYKLAGHGDIWNPVDNICAGVNYAVSRYGSLANVPGIRAMAGGGAYRGY
ncbi:WXG100 family type VII secretion target [Actinophytocola sp.]|uniref:WXG100 family type VII secretion target n=1 Tax=Actinophytocola sp. TaxID=1872138 RepID=UPI002D7F2D38|nr:transglycosylase SLT domain-containing protein [Actinophytocola sp.]HET9142171.1 transglycosylase SLT domain-containing protein [Actinophytocola sp.]